MKLLSKLRSLSGFKTRKNEKENFSLTISMQFDSFIARGQGQENKNLVFFPPLKERKKKIKPTKQ